VTRFAKRGGTFNPSRKRRVGPVGKPCAKRGFVGLFWEARPAYNGAFGQKKLAPLAKRQAQRAKAFAVFR